MADDSATQAGEDRPGDQAQDDKSDKVRAKQDLVKEKIELRQRAQAAEKERDSFKQQLDAALQERDSISAKVQQLEFEQKRNNLLRTKLSAIKDKRVVTDIGKLEKYTSKLVDPKTLDADLDEVISDWTEELAADGKSRNVRLSPTPVGSGARPDVGDATLNMDDPFSMLQLSRQNPAAYKAALNAANDATRRASAPEVRVLGGKK